MRKPEEITTSSPAGYHFTAETENEIQVIAIDCPITEELIQFAAQALGLVFQKQELLGGATAPNRTYVSAIFAKTDRFSLLRAFL